MDKYKQSNIQAFNERRFAIYDGQWGVRFFTRDWDRKIIQSIPHPIDTIHVIDVGCATGRLLLELGKAGAENLAGMDLAPKMIETAKIKLADHGLQADLKAHDAEKGIPWPDDTFDVVTMTGVLHHFTQPDSVLQEIHRVIKPNGFFCIIEVWFPLFLRKAINLYLSRFPRDGDHRYYSSQRVTQTLENAGFRNIKTSRVNLTSYLTTSIGSD